MADSSAPLLTHLEDDEEENTSQPLNFDKIFEQSLSGFGLSQFLQAILVGIALTFDSQQIFITVFTDAYPTWHCVDHTVCTPATTDVCKLPRSVWEWDDGFKGKSVISEFDLECSSSFLRGLPTSAFYIGSIVGGVFMAMIPDGFLGRKQLLFYTTLAMSLTGISIFLSTSIWSYALLKFAIGVARSQTGTYAFNLIGERVSTEWRPRATMIPFTLSVLGFMSLSGISFLVRHASWRAIYLCTSVPAAIHSICIYFFALESPRWLRVQGNYAEAFEVLKRISPGKRGYLESVSSRLPSKETLEQSPSSSIMDLFVRRWAFRRTVVVMIIMFGLGMMYYGVPLAVRDIKVNMYLSEALNAMVELPTFVITPILLEKFNRRSSVLVNCLVGGALGVFCFVLTLLGRTNMAFVFELCSFFCARIGFNLMAVYMIEMFPTCVRNFATTMLRLAVVVGGACCPIIASVGRNVPSISFAVFGFVVSGLGFFVLLLPETRGSSLCDTMDEQEQSDQCRSGVSSRLKRIKI
ncbi:Organic cation/carnitine transporter 5 [Raphanus sativus]|uniref:Organic cation/carnitine transporter 5-like n=1 Tax=Raphanus sativus TaxID=3726 RepID=A0A6J0K6I5_RAPSA|nr:organic cation/carnitine transporter 5-like [Raphanus sativus]KAJ4884741.1 Organic cation/carnitine transporter 5 [Raphanus sativus]